MVLLARAQTLMDSARGSRSPRKRGYWQKEGLDGGLCIELGPPDALLNPQGQAHPLGSGKQRHVLSRDQM